MIKLQVIYKPHCYNGVRNGAFILHNNSITAMVVAHTVGLSGSLMLIKGQLISKENFQAVNSSKKRTNEFVFTTMRRVFVSFLKEIEDTRKTFCNHLIFNTISNPSDDSYAFPKQFLDRVFCHFLQPSGSSKSERSLCLLEKFSSLIYYFSFWLM